MHQRVCVSVCVRKHLAIDNSAGWMCVMGWMRFVVERTLSAQLSGKVYISTPPVTKARKSSETRTVGQWISIYLLMYPVGNSKDWLGNDCIKEYRDTTTNINIPPLPPSFNQREIHYLFPQLSINHSHQTQATCLAFFISFFFNTLAKNFQCLVTFSTPAFNFLWVADVCWLSKQHDAGHLMSLLSVLSGAG